MANTTAWTAGVPKSTGEQITSAEFNALDDGQVAAITRGGTTTLTSAVVVDGGGDSFTFTDAPVKTNSLDYYGYSSALAFERMQNGTAKTLTNWTYSVLPYGYCQTSASGRVVIPLDNLPDGATMTAVSAILMGNVPSVGPGFAGLPAGMPSFLVYKTSPTAGTASSLGTATDATAVLATFNAAHTVTLSGLTEVIDHSAHYTYHIDLTGSFGANHQNGMGLLGVYCAFTTTKLKP